MWDVLAPSTQCESPTIDAIQLYLAFVAGGGGSAPPPSADVRITRIVYNPDGSDAEGELVTLHNFGSVAADMTGWKLFDVADNRFTFPSFVLPVNADVNVWVRSGVDTPTDLYWGSGSAIWNNGGDTATVADAGNVVVDVCSYIGGSMEELCEP